MLGVLEIKLVNHEQDCFCKSNSSQLEIKVKFLLDLMEATSLIKFVLNRKFDNFDFYFVLFDCRLTVGNFVRHLRCLK